ncbi:HAD family hydrolase [Actinocatenispora rupis]|uniref:Hydrolase n=2 Tax=Actinocatenispora rupis TaxID=519421 RepID=A0A8J3NDM7_9ACTN|nr:hydrolase [Actinocatenispora rupis]
MRSSLPKLVATDMDGTLVRSDGTVSERSREVLSRLRANGVVVVGATGRGPRLIELTRRDLGPADFLVMAQGARIYGVAQPVAELLHQVTLPGAALARVVRLVEAEAGPVHLAVEALDAPWAPLWRDEDVAWPYPEVTEARPRSEALRGPLIKGMLWSTSMDMPELLAVCRRVIPAWLCEASSSGEMVELAAPGCTKATGCAFVAEALGVDPGDTLVFGDMPNDVPMFRWAGHAVAVAGAHPEVLAVADEVTGRNDDDGVADYLERLLS